MNFRQGVQVGGLVLRNFILGGNLVSLRWLTNPRQLVGYNAETLFLYKAIARSRGLPQRNVFDVLPSANVQSISLGGFNTAGWFDVIPSYTQDIVELSLVTQILQPKVVFEIGTAQGYTSLHFALNSPDDARIYTLDVPRGQPQSTRLATTAMDEQQKEMYDRVTNYVFNNTPVAHKITCLYGDSAAFDYSPYHGIVDLFFIDGAHSYEYVRSDTLKALKCCHPGSVIAWHDFGRMGLNGVTRWLHEFAVNHAVYSIPGGSLAFMVLP